MESVKTLNFKDSQIKIVISFESNQKIQNLELPRPLRGIEPQQDHCFAREDQPIEQSEITRNQDRQRSRNHSLSRTLGQVY